MRSRWRASWRSPRCCIPARPGLTNALGCVVADLRHDFVRTVNRPLPEVADALARRVLDEQREGRAPIERERVAVDAVEFVHRADMQFQGQSHILTVALPGRDVTRDDLQPLFEAAYWQRFQVALPEIRPVLVNLHTAVIGRRRPVPLAALRAPRAATVARGSGRPNAARCGSTAAGRDCGVSPRLAARAARVRRAGGHRAARLHDPDRARVPGRADALGNLIVTV